jgi:hypothetical protein
MSLGSEPPPSVLLSSAKFGHPLQVKGKAHETLSDPPNRMRDAQNLG